MLLEQNEADTRRFFGQPPLVEGSTPAAPQAPITGGPRFLLPGAGSGYEIRRINYGTKPVGRELIEAILLSLLIFILVQSLVQNRKVDGESMEPTLQNEEHLLIDRVSYFHYDTNFLAKLTPAGATLPDNEAFLFSGPKRGDIVVFKPPVDDRDYIKRVIAVGGETVEVKSYDGVYVNGQKLDEPYIKDVADYNYGPRTIQPGTVFVLGDNRRNSSDSHAWGPLDVTSIVGRAWLSYLPSEDFGFLPHPSYAMDQK